MILQRKRITVRGMFGNSQVDAVCCGDWAVHRQTASPEMFCITLMPVALCLPLVWASFENEAHAISAMNAISRMRNSWSRVTQEDLTKKLGAELREICIRFGSVEGMMQMTQHADKTLLGLPTKQRFNNYQHPGA